MAIQTFTTLAGFSIANRAQRVAFPYSNSKQDQLLKVSRNFFIARYLLGNCELSSKQIFGAFIAVTLPFTLKWVEELSAAKNNETFFNSAHSLEEFADRAAVIATYVVCIAKAIFDPNAKHIFACLLLSGNLLQDFGPNLIDFKKKERLDQLIIYFIGVLGVVFLTQEKNADALSAFFLLIAKLSVDDRLQGDYSFRYGLDMEGLRHTLTQRQLTNAQIDISLEPRAFVNDCGILRQFVRKNLYRSRLSDPEKPHFPIQVLEKIEYLYLQFNMLKAIQVRGNSDAKAAMLARLIRNLIKYHHPFPKTVEEVTSFGLFQNQMPLIFITNVFSKLNDNEKTLMRCFFTEELVSAKPVFDCDNYEQRTRTILEKLNRLKLKIEKSKRNNQLTDRLDDLIDGVRGVSIITDRIATGLVIALEQDPSLYVDFANLGWAIQDRFQYCETVLDPLELDDAQKKEVAKLPNPPVTLNHYHLRNGISHATVEPCAFQNREQLIQWFNQIDWRKHSTILMAKAGGGRNEKGQYNRSFIEAKEYLRKGLHDLIAKAEDPKKDNNTVRIGGRLERIEVDSQKLNYQLSHIIRELQKSCEIDRVDRLCQLACEGGLECNQGVGAIIHRIYLQMFSVKVVDEHGDLMGQIHRYLHRKRAEIFWCKVQEIRFAKLYLQNAGVTDPMGLLQRELPVIDVHEKTMFLMIGQRWQVEDFDSRDNLAKEAMNNFSNIYPVHSFHEFMHNEYEAKILELIASGVSRDEPTDAQPISGELFERWLKEQGMNRQEVTERRFYDHKQRIEISEDQYTELVIARSKTNEQNTLEVREEIKRNVLLLLAIQMRVLEKTHIIDL